MMGSPTPLRNGGSPRTPSWATPKQTKEVGEGTNFVVSIDIWLRASFDFYISIFLCLSLIIVPVAKICCGFQPAIICDLLFIHFVLRHPMGQSFSLWMSSCVAKSNLQSQELTEPGNLGLDFETDDGLCIVSYLVAKLLVGVVGGVGKRSQLKGQMWCLLWFEWSENVSNVCESLCSYKTVRHSDSIAIIGRSFASCPTLLASFAIIKHFILGIPISIHQSFAQWFRLFAPVKSWLLAQAVFGTLEQLLDGMNLQQKRSSSLITSLQSMKLGITSSTDWGRWKMYRDKWP